MDRRVSGSGPAVSRAVRLLACAVWLALPAWQPLSDALWARSSQLEYRVKAAFLYNFARFVEWPSRSENGREEPIVFGVLGKDPFGAILDDTVRGRTIKKRPLTVRRFRSLQELEPCHVLFISRPESRRLAEILRALEYQSTLTVSDMEGFFRNGGMIHFVVEKASVRFDINLEPAERAELAVSSRLLKVARTVKNRP